MRIVIAPDSFKDALSAPLAAQHIARGIRTVHPHAQIDLCPIADGGEGFINAIAQAQPDQAHWHETPTTDPLGHPITARWLLVVSPNAAPTAAVELAAASGLERLSTEQRDPTRTCTHGTGLLIRDALEHNPAALLLGIGGSATNDAGCGITQALGVRFFDHAGRPMQQPIAGGDLCDIARIDTTAIDPRLEHCAIRIACDVTNPLVGPTGAAFVYGPQKGATPQQAQQLDAGLRHIATLWREQLGIDVAQVPGAGAAGGVGGGMLAMLGAELVGGAGLVLDAVGFDRRIANADLIITGEGRLDSQSLQGKAAMAVAERAAKAAVPCHALVGSVGEGAELSLAHGLAGYRVIGRGLSAADSIRQTAALLESSAADLARELS